jgi:putative membrane protein
VIVVGSLDGIEAVRRKEAEMMDWADSGWSWWWMLPMMLFMVALVSVVIWALVAVTRSGISTPEAQRATAEDILSGRFARGEIDATEYHERLDALHNDPAGARRT